jgi:lipid-A-disaccharide synthase-like uncharacterized protein
MLQQVGDFLYEVFAGKSVVPTAFWFFSIAGGLMTLAYGIVKREPVIIIGQMFGTFIYARNIMLIINNRGANTISDEPVPSKV